MLKKVIMHKYFNSMDELTKFVDNEEKPESEIKTFTSRIRYALMLGLKEKEIFFFGLLQLLVIMVGYVFWLQVLNWIPQGIWNEVQACIDRGEDDCTGLIDIALYLWGMAIVVIISFPVGILSCSIGTTHFLVSRNEESTVLKCLNASFSNAWAIWKFHAIDGYITIDRILERLPKDDDTRTPADKALEEAAYYAWKVGTAGMVPNLILGNKLIPSGISSINFVKSKFKEVASLRGAYSSICWLIAILSYIGAIILTAVFEDQLALSTGEIEIGTFYNYMIIPICFATLSVVVVLRPLYIISICDLYSDYLEENKEEAELPDNPTKGRSALITFVILMMLLIFLSSFGLDIGLGQFLE